MTLFLEVLQQTAQKLKVSIEDKAWSLEEKKILYRSACTFYQQKNYTLAHPLFMQLCATNPLEAFFWRGLAASLQMLSCWKEAMSAWCIVALLQEQDPTPHFHAAECLYLLKDPKEAIKALHQAEKRIAHAKEPSILQENISLLKDLIKRM